MGLPNKLLVVAGAPNTELAAGAAPNVDGVAAAPNTDGVAAAVGGAANKFDEAVMVAGAPKAEDVVVLVNPRVAGAPKSEDVAAVAAPIAAAPPKTELVGAAPKMEDVVETAGFPNVLGAEVVAPKTLALGDPKTFGVEIVEGEPKMLGVEVVEGEPKTLGAVVVEVAPKTLEVVAAVETAAPNGLDGVVVAEEPKTYNVPIARNVRSTITELSRQYFPMFYIQQSACWCRLNS